MADDSEQENKPAAKAEIVQVPHTIQEKVSGGGPLSDDMLAKAENVLEKHAVEYVARLQEQIEGLVKTVQNAAKDVKSRPARFTEIFKQSHDILGLGSTFGFNLITDIGASLCKFVENRKQYDDDAMEVVNAHVDALRAIVASGAKGDGGKIGREIVAGLSKVVAKVA